MNEKCFLNTPTLDQIEMRLESIEAHLASMSRSKPRELNSNWLTTKQAASALGVSIRTLQTYRDQGIVPFSQFGREIRYRQEDIQRFLMNYYFKPRFWDNEEGGSE